VTRRHFLIAIVLSVLAAAVALALAELLDAPWMRIVAVVLVLESLVTREIWMWWGEGRLWLIVHGTLLGGTIAMAAIAQLIAG
jgi:hypothetical protein